MLPVEYCYLTGLPIELGSGLDKINQPKLLDFFESGLTVEEFAQPFCVRVDAMDLGDDEVVNQLLATLKDFDLFFVDESEMLKRLKKSLSIIYKTENIYINTENQCLVIDNGVIINRDSYTSLAKVVLEMLCLPEPKKPESKRKYKDDYRQKIWEKMQRYRAEKEKKDATTTLDMMNTIIHGMGVRYDEILNFTYYQLVNSFITYTSKNSYDEYMMFKSSGQFKLEDNVKHWTITTKIKKGTAL